MKMTKHVSFDNVNEFYNGQPRKWNDKVKLKDVEDEFCDQDNRPRRRGPLTTTNTEKADPSSNGHTSRLGILKMPSLDRRPLSKQDHTNTLPTLAVSEGKDVAYLLLVVGFIAVIGLQLTTIVWTFLESGIVVELCKKVTIAVASNASIVLSAIAGVGCVFFSWSLVYMDSEIPGVSPPAPFSHSKTMRGPGHAFQLNYMVHILIGFSVFIYGVFYFQTILPESVKGFLFT